MNIIYSFLVKKMEIVLKKPVYSKIHGNIRTFSRFCDIFPNGLQICNGREFERTKEDFQRFRSHLLHRGKKCKCPNFEKGSDEFINVSEYRKLDMELRNSKILNTLIDEKRILLENEIKEKNKKLELLKDNINNFFLKNEAGENCNTEKIMIVMLISNEI